MSKTSPFKKKKDGNTNSGKNRKHEIEVPGKVSGKEPREKDAPQKKWSNERVLDEMSSFIAEFSYLTPETQDSNHSKHDPTEQGPSYAVYTAHGYENNGSIFKKHRKQDSYWHGSESNLQRKSVEWMDRKGDGYYKKRKHEKKPRKIYYSSADTSDKEESKPYKQTKQKRRDRKHLKYHYNNPNHKYVLRKKSRAHKHGVEHRGSRCRCETCSRARTPISITSSKCSCKECSRRSRSRGQSQETHRHCIKRKPKRSLSKCCEPFSIKKDKTPIRHKPRQWSRSECYEEIKQPPCCPDRSGGKRSPKHMPIKYDRNKIKCDEEITPKRENCIRYKGKKCKKEPFKTRKSSCSCCESRKEIRDQIVIERKISVTDSPTLITLFPKNNKIKYKKLNLSNEVEFLANTELPCKCFKCVKKYESLVKIMSPSSKTVFYEPADDFKPSKHEDGCKVCPKSLLYLPKPYTNQSCAPSKKLVQFPQKDELLESDWPAYKPCSFPCDNGDFMTEWNTYNCDKYNNCRRYFKSVYFRLNCVNQQIDSTITQYFQSILNSEV